jgi:hypothetical protein
MKHISIHVDLAKVTTTNPDLLGADVGSTHEGKSGRGVCVDLVPALTVVCAEDSNGLTLSSGAAVLLIIAINSIEIEDEGVREELRNEGHAAID